MKSFDVVVVGAGAAGMMCAGVAGQRGARVLVIDHSRRLAEKIRISGGGRCNFTNVHADRPERFLGGDPRFVRDVLRGFAPARFIALVRRHGIDHHEKHRGQLFCDDSSERIIAMLRDEMARGDVLLWQDCAPSAVRARDGAADGARYEIDTPGGTVLARHLVIASGGLSIPAIGASDFGFRIARQFGLRVVEPRPGLVPLRFDPQAWAPFAALSGLSLEVDIEVAAEGRRPTFREDLLFTHRGLSGPAILQISSYWRPGQALSIDLAAGQDLAAGLHEAKRGGRAFVETVLAQWLPKRLAGGWLAQSAFADLAGERIPQVANRRLDALAQAVRAWPLTPVGSEGFRKAEVTVGGVATDELDPRTMGAHRSPGLVFIGEVVDVTGWLGGYNFQWAWASAVRAAEAMTAG
ncbi:MAG: aminoacetone oxidase family FAD-binding enzyme [Burkholderiaceae bacterium]